MITIESNSPTEATVRFVWVTPTQEVVDLLTEHGLDGVGNVVEGRAVIEPEVAALTDDTDKLRPLLDRRVAQVLAEIGATIWKAQVDQQAGEQQKSEKVGEGDVEVVE